MLTYKIDYHDAGYTSVYYVIHVLLDNEVVGCIYYINDSLKGSKADVKFDKWRRYNERQVPTIDPLKVAEETIFEHYFLTERDN